MRSKTGWMLGISCVLALTTSSVLAAQAAQPSNPPAQNGASATTAQASDNAKEREVARLLLARGGSSKTTPTTAQPTQNGSANSASGKPVYTGAPSAAPEPVYVNPVDQANADAIRIDNEIRLRQAQTQDEIDRAYAQANIRQQQVDELRQDRFSNMAELEITRDWFERSQAQSNSLLFMQTDLAQRNLDREWQITSNRQQYYQGLSDRKWDNWNRARATIGDSLGTLGAPAAGILNAIAHGNEDQIDSAYEKEFNAQQSALMGDLNESRSLQKTVINENIQVLRMQQQMLLQTTNGLQAQRALMPLPSIQQANAANKQPAPSQQP